MCIRDRYDGSVVTIAAHDFRVLVVGLGVTGVATARYLAARGVDVTVIDSRAVPPGLADLRSSNPAIKVVTESEDPRWLEGIGQVVLSPGLALGFADCRARGPTWDSRSRRHRAIRTRCGGTSASYYGHQR